MSHKRYDVSTLEQFVGQELGVSDWLTVDQERINEFADCTGDHQWIHVDIERAKREGPLGSTIAHGYLTLSLLAAMQMEMGIIPAGVSQALNYGLDRVRFIAPVKAGARIRTRVVLLAWALLHYPRADQHDLQKIARNLRIAISGGAAMPVEVMLAFNEKFSVKILEGYGLSETSPIATFSRLDREARPGSIGFPVWGVQVRLVDQDDQDVGTGELGEIAIKGHNVMKGYYKRPEATAEAMRHGWFHTGDIGRRDEDGYLYIVDRVKDMVIRGGFNVYPREIEEVLLTHPAVSLAAVIGVPHDRHGEEVKAFVILKEGATITEVELVAWSKQNMADYKYPRIIEFRESLPMTATGKVLKSELRS